MSMPSGLGGPSLIVTASRATMSAALLHLAIKPRSTLSTRARLSSLQIPSSNASFRPQLHFRVPQSASAPPPIATSIQARPIWMGQKRAGSLVAQLRLECITNAAQPALRTSAAQNVDYDCVVASKKDKTPQSGALSMPVPAWPPSAMPTAALDTYSMRPRARPSARGRRATPAAWTEARAARPYPWRRVATRTAPLAPALRRSATPTAAPATGTTSPREQLRARGRRATRKVWTETRVAPPNVQWGHT